MTIRELQDKAGKAVADARAIHAKADGEKREMSNDESAAFDAAMKVYTETKAEIDKLGRSEARAKALADAQEELRRVQPRITEPPRGAAGREAEGDGEERGKVVEFELRGRKYRFDRESRQGRRCTPEYREAFRAELARTENRDIQTNIEVDGGYLVAGEDWVAELLKNIDDETMIRQWARVLPPTLAQKVGFPTRTAKAVTAAWGQELTPPTKDTSLKFGKRSLTPHYMTFMTLLSRDTLASDVMPVDQIVREEMSRDVAELEEQAFISGDGAQKPLGVLTASNDGIPTTRDVNSGAANTVTADAVLDLVASVKNRYRASPKFCVMGHRLTFSTLRKLKDANGQYLWQPSLVAGKPDTFAATACVENDWFPQIAANAYALLAGDWSKYFIVDGLDFGLQILDQPYALSNQVAYVGRRKVDAQPVVAEAFSRMKIAA